MSSWVLMLIGIGLGYGFMHFVVMRPLRKIDREIMEARAEMAALDAEIAKTHAEIMALDAEVEAEINRQIRETRN